MSTTQTLTWTVGDRLRKAREDAGIGVAEMAVMIGKGRNTVTNYEHDRSALTAEALMAYVSATAASAEWIMFGEEARGPSDLPFSPSACYGGGAEILAFPTRVMGSKVA